MKKLILLFSLMAICAFAFADTYIIGTGTSTTYYCPFNGLWDYSWSKAIWTAAELTAAGLPADTPIIGIGFYVGNTPSNYTMLDQRIYVRTTTLTSYSTATDETGTGYPNPAYFLNLFQGDLTYNGSGWHYITFETPVSWDGTSNLELLFENWDGDYVTGYPTFCYTSTSPDYRTVYKSQDNSFPAVAGTRSYNRPNVAIITPSTTPPGAPVLSAPADGATLVSITPTFSWTAPTTGGLPTGYKVYLGESPDLTDADIIADVTGLSYTVPSSNPLQYNHTYYWTVVAYNDNGNGPQADVRSFTTLEEGYITIGTGTSTQRQPFGVYFGYERSAALYTNDQIGGYGLLDEVAWNCATTSTANVPYKIYVMQTNDTALTAMTWDAFTTNATLVAEGTHTFDTTGWHLFELGIPFPYTAGNLIIGVETNYGGGGTSPYPYFYYSTGATASHQYWYADNTPPAGNGTTNTNLPNIMLHLGALPQEPVINVSPSSWDFGLTVINTTKTKLFTLSNAGAGTLTINNITIAGNYYTLQINPANPLPINLTIGQSATFTVQYAPTAVGTHNGTVTITDNRGTTVVNLSGQCYDPTITAAQLPYTNSFEDIWEGTPPAPVLGWTVINANNDSYTWRRGPTYITAHTGLYIAQGMGNTDDWLITPPIQASIDLRIKWWDKVESAYYPNTYTVLVSTTDNNIASFTNNLGTFTCTSTVWTQHTLNLDAFTGNTIYVAFHQTASGSTVYDFGIDDFLLEEIPQVPILYYSPTSINFGLLTQNVTSSSVNVTVTNNGAGILTFYRDDVTIVATNPEMADMFSADKSNIPETGTQLAAGQSVIIPVTATVTTEGPVSATLRITYNNTNYDVALSAEGLPAGTVIIGTGTSTQRQPFGILWGFERSAALYTNAQIGSYGILDKVSWNCATTSTATVPYKIYAMQTTNTALSQMTWDSFIANATRVDEGTHIFNTTGWHLFELDTPFTYNSGNLIVAVETYYGGTGASSPYFYYTAGAANTHQYWYQDNTPPTGTGYLNANIPNIMLHLSEFPSGPPNPVTLTYPANGATGLPKAGFNLMWTPATTGGAPDYYAVYMSQSEETIYGDYYWETTNTSFNPVTDPVPPEIPVQFDYNQRWFWTVEAVNDDGGAVVEPPYMFTIAPHPGVLGVNPSSLTQTLTIPDNITATRQLTLSNTGELPLNYRVKIEETTERRNSITPIEQINPPAHLNPDWTGYNEKSPFIGPVVESEARALFDVQFIYPTYMNQGEYGIATDGTYFYTANWGGNNIYGFNKYALDGTYIETFTITGVPGIRDLAYDGTYFYGAAVSTTIYKMDFNTHTLVGTLTCPVSARGIAYDEDNDAFWVSNNWAADLRLINRSGNQLAAVTPAVAAFAGLAYDNFSGTNPTIWGNTQNGTYGATLVQIDISTGATLQSLEITEAILPGITTDDIAGGLEIYPNIVNGKVSLIPLMQNWCFYGLELCDIENWLSVEPKSGTINPGETPTVNVTFDASDLDLGTYTANIKFNHNGENTPVVVPVTLTVGGTYPAVFSITPDVAYNFGTIEQLNPAVKTFTITNTGGSSPTPLTIDVDGIYLTNDAEHNFVIDAPNLPVSLGHNETYQFTVSFIPQTIGNKTATLNIQDNLTSKVLHTVALSGTAVAEHIFIPVNLTATVREQDVSLSWASYSGIPGSPGWLHYDNGENYDAIGTGDVGTFEVAIRFDSGTMYGYAGMELTKVKYFPRSANTAYTIKVWTGNDGTYTPSTLVYSQTHTPIVNQWNEVELNTHIPITGTQALWIGYECVVSTGTDYYPAGCDAGPAVVGYGDLISLGTWESMAIGYGLNYNWNLQGYFEVSEGGKAPQLLSIPVINQEQRSKEHMAIRFTTSGNSNPPTRVLRGYNIYRDEMQINTELVPTTTYTDHLVPYGTHTYTVQGVYYSALSPMSNPVVVNVTPPVPYPLPFVETWASGDFTTNQWNASATNWLIDDYEGMEPPCACFYWSPRLTNYQEYLTSWYLDANGIPNVKFKFDMELDNYSTTTENLLIPQVWDGTTWHTIHTFSSLDNQGDGLPWDTYEYDISAYAGNRMFRIRFLAAGGDTYDINDWYIDNIVLEAIQVILPPTPAITFDGTYVKLTWEPVSGANGYKIWAASDPYATEWTELAYIAGTTYTYTGTDNIKFFKVTAVTEVPVKGVNDLRTREITPSNHSIKTDKGLSPKKEKQIKQ